MSTTIEKVLAHPLINSLIQEAGAFRCLNEAGKSIRTFSAGKAATLRKDPNYCSGQLYHALPGERGEVGLKFLADGVIQNNPDFAPYRDAILAAIWDALPICQHEILEETLTRGHKSDYPTPPAGPNSLNREQPKGGFFSIIKMLEHAAGTGPEPKSIVNWETPQLNTGKFGEPVFLVRTEDDQRATWINIDGPLKIQQGQFSKWYGQNGVMTVPSIEGAVAAALESPKDVMRVLGGRPAVLTFQSEKLITALTGAGIPVAQISGVPESWEKFQQAAVFVGKAVTPGAEDMPETVLDGWLGEICRTRMERHAIAYAWPALLTIAGALIDGKSNLFTCLVGDPGTGKGQAIDHAGKLLGVAEPLLMALKSGSAEGLATKIGDIGGDARIFAPDELLHTMQKARIENASFASFFNSAFDGPLQNLTMARGRQVTFNCRLSILGGVVLDKFGDAFGGATTGGLYDRFIFGLGPSGYSYQYLPFEGGCALGENEDPFSETARPCPVTIDPSVYRETGAWQKNDPKLGRLVQLAIRAAYIAAAFDNRPVLQAGDLGPAFAFLQYQKAVRGCLAPNPGANTEGILCGKYLAYLAQNANADLPIGEREMFLSTHAYDYGAGAAAKALGALVLNGDIERYRTGKKYYVKLTKD